MKTFSAIALFLTVIVTVLTSWVPERWPTTVPEAAVFAITAVWTLAGLTGLVRLRFSTVMIPLGLVVVWCAIQIAGGTTAYAWRTNVAMLYWGCNAATFFVALQIFASRRIGVSLLHALMFFGLAMSIVGPLQELYGGGKVLWLFEPFPRFVPQFGPFPYRNQYAAFIELLLPVALFGALTQERRRGVYVVTTAVLYASVIAAASRMGFVLATLEMLAVPFIVFWNRKVRFRSLRNNALLFAAIFAMLIVAAGPSGMLTKFRSPDPYAARREYSEAGLKMILARPLTGFGLGNYATVYPGFAVADDGLHINQAHNDWVQWAAEGGLPFLAVMLWIALWAAPRALRSGWGAGVAAVFLHCLVDYPIQRTSVALVMFIMMAAIARPPDGADEPA